MTAVSSPATASPHTRLDGMEAGRGASWRTSAMVSTKFSPVAPLLASISLEYRAGRKTAGTAGGARSIVGVSADSMAQAAT
jgi:hypothetical protein